MYAYYMRVRIYVTCLYLYRCTHAFVHQTQFIGFDESHACRNEVSGCESSSAFEGLVTVAPHTWEHSAYFAFDPVRTAWLKLGQAVFFSHFVFVCILREALFKRRLQSPCLT